jgi:DNA-binding response OmpR family regulator
MKPDVLVIEPDITLFAIADRRLHERFNLLWAPTPEAAMTALRKLGFDAVLVRAEEIALIARLRKEHPTLPLIAVAPWEVQGDRAVENGAHDWVSSPINFPRLAAVLVFAIAEAHREARREPGPLVHAPA